ncbi:conserved hypothetical protein, partial [Bordetella bronchiseptica Bbr77]
HLSVSAIGGRRAG